jgi:hypothetical protein
MRASILFVHLPVFICLFTIFSFRNNSQPIHIPNGKFEFGVDLISRNILNDLNGNTRAANTFLKDRKLPITNHYKKINLVMSLSNGFDFA